MHLEPSCTNLPRTRIVWLIVWVAWITVARNLWSLGTSMWPVRTERWLVGKERRVGASPDSPLLRLKPHWKGAREGAPLAWNLDLCSGGRPVPLASVWMPTF